ncbi:MAG: DUF3300 domain-containing protein [Candidatus Eremiobacteraeota bacterium]|nr:DUF3300 domain-containing protein [Candidatus Eremiobacteraeota bacterium]
MRQHFICHGRLCRPALIALLLLLLGFGAMPAVWGQEAASLNPTQLESIVAPIALYPDDLLTNVLTAATVPGEVNEAAQLLKSSGGKVSSMPDNDWDPSVKALLSFPDVLNKMNDDLNWTQNLGNAVINQMNDVISAVQAFRSKVLEAGNLKSTEQQKVSQDQSIITIEPTDPEVIYVPQYDCNEVVNTGYPGLAFASGVAVSNWWRYRSMDWVNHGINAYPPYLSHYNYRPGGYYYNNFVPRPGYTAPGTWRPVATPYGAGNAYRAGNAYNAGNAVRTGNATRAGNTVRAGNDVNINTGGNRADFNRNTANTANRMNQSSTRISTSDLNAQLKQGFQNTGGSASARINSGNFSGSGLQRPGAGGAGIQNTGFSGSHSGFNSGAFGGMNSGSSARLDSARGASSRSSFQSSGGFSGGSRGGFSGGSRGGGGRRR